jgi:hypothetical protein
MTTRQHAIRDRLDEFGWELAAHDDIDAWWADDMWRLRSTWSPQGSEVYLTFLVDPQADIHRRKPGENVWAVKASATRPTREQKAEGDYVLDFGHGWRERLPELFSHLARMRNEHMV